MEKLIDKLSAAVAAAFLEAGYDPACGKVTVSNRPDLCEFQCNGAMPAAKAAHKAPILIANDVAAHLQDSSVFSSAEAVAPGFINLRVREDFLAAHIEQMRRAEKLGVTGEPYARAVVLDYGGPNVAKPLHIGHLRSAIIGESIKRIYRYFGNTVVGDIHLGDWGLQMGLIIAELRLRQPNLPYFDDNYTGDYPAAELAVFRRQLHRRLPRRSTVHDLRAGGDLPDCQREEQGRRGLRAAGARGDLFPAEPQARLLRPLGAHHARLRRRPEAQL